MSPRWPSPPCTPALRAGRIGSNEALMSRAMTESITDVNPPERCELVLWLFLNPEDRAQRLARSRGGLSPRRVLCGPRSRRRRALVSPPDGSANPVALDMGMGRHSLGALGWPRRAGRCALHPRRCTRVDSFYDVVSHREILTLIGCLQAGAHGCNQSPARCSESLANSPAAVIKHAAASGQRDEHRSASSSCVAIWHDPQTRTATAQRAGSRRGHLSPGRRDVHGRRSIDSEAGTARAAPAASPVSRPVAQSSAYTAGSRI